MKKQEKINAIVRARAFYMAAMHFHDAFRRETANLDVMYDLMKPEELDYEIFQGLQNAIRNAADAMLAFARHADPAHLSTDEICEMAYGMILDDEQDELLNKAEG